MTKENGENEFVDALVLLQCQLPGLIRKFAIGLGMPLPPTLNIRRLEILFVSNERGKEIKLSN